MPQQLSLLPPRVVTLQPAEGRTQPRLWVRRLKVWREPGKLVREVELRPGLNIVWSPDPSELQGEGQDDGPLGHGSGKTMFCRLLRYCLGEERFAPEDHRQRIASAYNDGLVGAEVVIDGESWAVIRAIGHRRHNVVVKGGDLDALASFDVTPTGMDPLLVALITHVITPAVAKLVAGSATDRAWLTALAWLTRDQECRFDHVMDWRATSSGSDSPVRDRDVSRADLVEAVRALLGAITPEEQHLREEIRRLEREKEQAERELRRWSWTAQRQHKDLVAALPLPMGSPMQGRMAIEPLRRAATEAVAREGRVDLKVDASDLPALRAQAREATRREANLRGDLRAIQGDIEVAKQLITRMQGEIPGLSYAEHDASNPECPVCEVPIDRVLAQGCPLPVKGLADLETVRARRDRHQRALDQERARKDTLEEQAQRLESAVVTADVEANELAAQVEALEQARDVLTTTRTDAWQRVADVSRLEKALDEELSALGEQQRSTKAVEDAREKAGALRDAQRAVFARVSELFDWIVQDLARGDARGTASLTGRGIELGVEMGGNRSTAAIDSLKVLAFDLAAMMMAIEGRAAIPAFLVHDSPREADLGLSVYHRLFRLVHALEAVGGQPMFQYIITTTTRPPAELCDEPWLRVTLRGAPARERFLCADL